MEELKTIIEEFRRKRKWDESDTLEGFGKSIIIEAAELLEHFQWDESHYNIKEISYEIADVLIYALAMCYHLDIDPKELIKEKLEDVAKRYPEKTK